MSERQRAHDMLWNLLPVNPKAQGLLNDARYVTTPQQIPLDQIRMPTLLVSMEDDFYHTFEPARYLAARIPGARLLTYPTGGHLWIGHNAELFAEVDAFIRQH